MPGVFDIFFNEKMMFAKGFPGFFLAGGKRRRHLVFTGDNPHAFSAAARRRLDQNRKSDLLGNRHCFLNPGQCTHMPGNDRNAGLLCKGFGSNLIAQSGNGGRRRSDKHQAGSRYFFTELCVFRKKSVSGMDGLTTGFECGVDNFFSHQIGFGGTGVSQQYGFIGLLHMKASGVCVGIYRHGLDARLLACPNDADGDFSTIGNQNFIKH